MIRFEITGLSAFQRSLNSLQIRIEQAAQNTVVETAVGIVRKAKLKAPIKTGKLRDSIRIDKSLDGVWVLTDVPYAAAVEFGTLKKPAKPFMLPAVEEQRVQIQNSLNKNINTALGS